MAYSLKTTHVTEGLAHLISQFQGKENLEKYICSFIKQIQDLENAANEIAKETYDIDLAVGANLDNIGTLVGEPRLGRTDADYRNAIRTRIAINKSNGTIEDVLEVIKALVVTNSLEMTELFPAAFAVDVLGTFPATIDLNQVANFIRAAKGAGINGMVIVHPATPVFAFDGAAGTGYDVGNGKYSTAVA